MKCVYPGKGAFRPQCVRRNTLERARLGIQFLERVVEPVVCKAVAHDPQHACAEAVHARAHQAEHAAWFGELVSELLRRDNLAVGRGEEEVFGRIVLVHKFALLRDAPARPFQRVLDGEVVRQRLRVVLDGLHAMMIRTFGRSQSRCAIPSDARGARTPL